MIPLQTVNGEDFSIYKEDCGFTLARQYSSLKAEDYSEDELKAISEAFNSGIEKLNNAADKAEADKITQDTMAQVNELSKVNYVPEERE